MVEESIIKITKKDFDDLEDKFSKIMTNSLIKQIETRISILNYFLPINIGMIYFAWKAEQFYFTLLFLGLALIIIVFLSYMRHSLVYINRLSEIFQNNLPLNYDFYKRKDIEIIIKKLEIETIDAIKDTQRSDFINKMKRKNVMCYRLYTWGIEFSFFIIILFVLNLFQF